MSKKILLVDDIEENCMLLKVKLSKLGHEVDMRFDGETAV